MCLPRLRSHRQHGAALLLVVLLVFTLGVAFLLDSLDTASILAARDAETRRVLVQAKEALLGDTLSGTDYVQHDALRLPDLGTSRNSMASTSEGGATGEFSGNTKNLSVIGRFPWRTLGLVPLKDAQGECLWYAVSNAVKAAPKPISFNWDTLGAFEIFRADGTRLGSAPGSTSTTEENPHDRALAVIFSAGPPLAGQDRQSLTLDVVTECAGNYDARNYLDALNYFPGSTNNASGDTADAPKALVLGPSEVINDHLITISSKEIFDRVKSRHDFKASVDALLDDLSSYLNTFPPSTLPAASGSKGIDAVINECRSSPLSCPINSAAKKAFLSNWQDNLLYAGGPTGNLTVNGVEGCKAVLIFAGERGTRTIAPLKVQTRSPSQKNDSTMYLEGINASSFPNGDSYAGRSDFDPTSASADIVRCITGLSSEATQLSFASDLSSAASAGAANGAVVSINSAEQTVSMQAASGATSGCLWFPQVIPLAGKTLRAYYHFQFTRADTYATSGASADRGHGFTFSLVRSDLDEAPDTCGKASDLGALPGLNSWGSYSHFIETDVRQNSAGDPPGNHTAVMSNGDLTHPSGSVSTPCNGSNRGCQHTPANTFEESPAPLWHHQRLEIQTGCSSTCAQCNPASTGSYARVSVWVDCADCSDLTRNYLASELILREENRSFSGPGNWSGTKWTLVDNTLTHEAGANAASLSNTALTNAPSAGRAYQIEIKLETSVAGSLNVALGGSANKIDLLAGASHHQWQILAQSGGALSLTPNASWVGRVLSISVRAQQPPSASRCLPLYPQMNQVYFGLTGGFLSSANTAQGVSFKNLSIRSE